MQTNSVRALVWIGALGAGVVVSACSSVVDGVIRGRDAGADAGACAGATDGTPCGEGQVCVDEVCETRGWCHEDGDCDDGVSCNGEETCGEDHACVPGTPLASGLACQQPSGEPGLCREGACLPIVCGDGTVDEGEDCDDGNAVDGDGCDSDCTFSCVADADCDDGSVCTGEETCDTESHVCVPGTALECDDGSACTVNACDDVLGCVFELIDADRDGHAPTALGACGTDCDDARADVYPGAPELCDGRDNDCNGVTDDGAPVWYVDCDRDGYAVNGTDRVEQCDAPVHDPPGCVGGGWTTRNPDPSLNAVDCAPNDPDVHPGAEEIPGDEQDQNCDGIELCWLDADGDGFRPLPPAMPTVTSTDLDCRDAREARTSAPQTDCCDTDENARPGQTSFFSYPRTGCGGYDFDCDGTTTYEFPGTVAGCQCGGSCAAGSECFNGWRSGRPACGTYGQRLRCFKEYNLSCTSHPWDARAACR